MMRSSARNQADQSIAANTMAFAATGRPAFGSGEISTVVHDIVHTEPDLRGLPSPLREVVAACGPQAS
jgi:hypothetical protein